MTKTEQPTRRVAYIATICREGNEYVARDENGSKRAWGKANDCDSGTAMRLAESLFHAKEIGNATRIGAYVSVEILDFSEPKPVNLPSTDTFDAVIAMAATADELRTRIDTLDQCRSAACYSNPLLAHCLERVLTDLRKSADELAILATLTKGGE